MIADKGFFLSGLWINGELAYVAEGSCPEACAFMIHEEMERMYDAGIFGAEDAIAFGPMTPAEVTAAGVLLSAYKIKTKTKR